MKSSKFSDWYVPPDIALTYSLPFAIICITVLSGMLLPLISRAHGKGDLILLYTAFALGALGIVLLAFAKLPLYRQRRFSTFGPGALDKRHRRVYRWAYCFIGVSVVLLSFLLLALR